MNNKDAVNINQLNGLRMQLQHANNHADSREYNHNMALQHVLGLEARYVVLDKQIADRTPDPQGGVDDELAQLITQILTLQEQLDTARNVLMRSSADLHGAEDIIRNIHIAIVRYYELKRQWEFQYAQETSQRTSQHLAKFDFRNNRNHQALIAQQRELQSYQSWKYEVDVAFTDYANIQIFPSPPAGPAPCPKPTCAAKERELDVCDCQIQRVFAVLGADLKAERRAWHPDRFAACTEEKRQEFMAKAKEVFQVVDRMYVVRKARQAQQAQQQQQAQPQSQTNSTQAG